MTSPSAPSSLRCSACGTHHEPGGACPATAGLHVGSVLDGKYELLRLIGSGGMGEVYEGRHRVIGRRVAVKFLHGEHARRPEVASRFANEARAAGGIEHENIAGVYDVGGLADGTQYLVMEFLDGQDLERLVATEGPLPVPRVIFAILQACRALDVVHSRGIVHRDLKPSNLFVTKRADKTDLVKVIDFGIAKLTGLGDAGATKTGTAMGTAHYMSPEQARGERDVGPATDTYALGVILYELLSGQKPFVGDSFLQVLHQVMLHQPVPLATLRPGLPEPLYAIVERAMAAEATSRFPTVAALGDALLPYAGRPLAAIRSTPAALPPSADTMASPPSEIAPFVPQAAARRGTATTTPVQAEERESNTAGGAGRRTPLLVGAFACAAAVAGGLFFALRPQAAPPPAGAISVTPDAAAPTNVMVEAPVRVAPVATIAPLVESSTVLSPRASEGSGRQTDEKHAPAPAAAHPAPPTRPPGPATSPAPKPAPNCDPPYTIDEAGHHHYKAECIQ